jgi:hypothetical protein
VKYDANKCKEATCSRRRRAGGQEGKPDFAHFMSIFVVQVVGFDWFDGFPGNGGMVSLNVCEGFSIVRVWSW